MGKFNSVEEHPDYLEYREIEENMREELECNYQYAVFSGDMASAYNTLGKLMKYRLIPLDDKRIEKNNRSYTKFGVRSKHRFSWDYRNNTSYIASWIYGDIKRCDIVNQISIEHCGKRIEGCYEGYMIFPSRQVKMRISLADNVMAVRKCFENIEKSLKESSKKVSVNLMGGLCERGVYRVFSIDVDGGCAEAYKHIGDIVIRQGDTRVEAMFIIRYENIMNIWLDISQLLNNLESCLNGMIGERASIKLIIKPNKFILRQQERIKMNKSFYDGLQKDLITLEQQELEKAAKKEKSNIRKSTKT